jgi:hypothetical protein
MLLQILTLLNTSQLTYQLPTQILGFE